MTVIMKGSPFAQRVKGPLEPVAGGIESGESALLVLDRRKNGVCKDQAC